MSFALEKYTKKFQNGQSKSTNKWKYFKYETKMAQNRQFCDFLNLLRLLSHVADKVAEASGFLKI